MRIAAFISHPIQYFTPLWQEVSRIPEMDLKVFYFSRHGLDPSFDPGFGKVMAWDNDLLAGHLFEFLPRQWPTRDPLDCRPTALNAHLLEALRGGWDAVCISGYAHVNNWFIVATCAALGIPVLCFGDTIPNTDRARPLWRRAGKYCLLRPFVRSVSAFLLAGGQSRSYFAKYGAHPGSMFVCPYVVDVAAFRDAVSQAGADGVAALRQRFAIPPGKRIVAFCGKLVAWKRPLDLVHALQKLDREDVVGLFIGDGSLREELGRTGGDLVRVTGFVNRSEIPLALSAADVLVLPSEVEPYGLVVSEAQALGIPCVVSDQCGCYGQDSVLQDGLSGFVFPVGDVDALATHIQNLLNDTSLHQRMSAAALEQGELQSPIRAAQAFAAANYAAPHAKAGL